MRRKITGRSLLSPGDPNIARELSERALTAKAFFTNHGVVVTGGSLADAVDNTEELEETAKLYFTLQHKNCYLTEAEVKDLEHRGNDYAKNLQPTCIFMMFNEVPFLGSL